MNINIECCDLCHAPIKGLKYGVKITCGHSKGGWGLRENAADWSGEVCPKCYEEYQVFAGAAKYWLDKRKGTRMPKITVTEHDVSSVRTDEPSPEGRGNALLR